MKGGRLVGSVKVGVHGFRAEELINQASRKGIKVWNIQEQESTVIFSTDSSGLKQLRGLEKAGDLTVEILRESGFLVWLKRIWRRKFWVVGFFCFCLAIYYLSGLVWSIELKGADQIDSKELEDYISDFGLYRWGKVRNLELNDIEQNLYLKFPQIAWVAVERKGTKVIISLVEKKYNPMQFGAVIDIVAKYDGIIFEMMVLKGIAKVKPGMTVAKGDVLIAGYRDGDQVVNAAGSVKGKAFIEGYGEAALVEIEQSYTGNQRQMDILELWGKKITLSPMPKYEYYEIEESFTEIFRDKVLLRHRLYSEITKRTNNFSPGEAEDLARFRALIAADVQLGPHAVITNKEVESLSQQSPFIYRVLLTVETDIGNEMVQIRGE